MSLKMDGLTEAVSRLDLTTSPPSSPDSTAEQNKIEAAFNKITSHVRVFRSTLPSSEVNVTKDLARPFKPGGIVFFLLEPLHKHPWENGTQAVISSCPTLDALDEGLSIASSGHFNLKEHATVIDLNAFVSKEVKSRLCHQQIEELYDRVFAFLHVKRPRVILGMGRDVEGEIAKRRSKFTSATTIICTKHPSYSVNYKALDTDERIRLLEDIVGAVDHLPFGDNDPCPASLAILKNPHYHHEHYPESIGLAIHFLRAMEGICFVGRLNRPKLNLTPGSGYYCLAPCHIRHLMVLMRGKGSVPEIFRGAVAGMFLNWWNQSIKLASWYLDSYEVNWEGLISGLRSALSKIGEVD
ncbi:uncharacterized protein BDV14DRAFT_173849 [Aspergillus stella-maris]|uniref:uncharacterized protein n=1 Tax=Aspergillus stella-maris TaxID=1810926 RepID=UPI003CCD8B31